MKLAKGAKIKKGMTEKQLDGVLTGKGLGRMEGLETIDIQLSQTSRRSI